MGAMANLEKYGLVGLSKSHAYPYNLLGEYLGLDSDEYDSNTFWEDATCIAFAKPIECVTFCDLADKMGFGKRIKSFYHDGALFSLFKGQEMVAIVNGSSVVCKPNTRARKDMDGLIKKYGKLILGWDDSDPYLSYLLNSF